MWKRNVTRRDVNRAGAGASGVVVPGPWRISITRAGMLSFYNTPTGPPIRSGFRVKAAGPHTLTVRFPDDGSGECAFVGTYRWHVTGVALVLTKRRDDCGGRAAVLNGTWRRPR